MKELTNCPNCKIDLDTEIVINGKLTTLELYSENRVKLINTFLDSNSDFYCSKCGYSLYYKSKQLMEKEIRGLKDFIAENLKFIPIVTTHSPLNWDYDVLSIVTGQSTVGTGALTEIVSSFTDLFGIQSELHNEKLKKGEEHCFIQLKMQTLSLGGNAIIATDIDYSEIGSLKGILMVCASGTAIKLNSLNKLKILDELYNSNKKLQELEELNKVI